MSNFEVGDLVSFHYNLTRRDYRTRYFLIISDTATTFRLKDITNVETLNFTHKITEDGSWDQFDEKLSVNISQQEMDKILATKTYHKKNTFISKKKKEMYYVKKITLNQTDYKKGVKTNVCDYLALSFAD